MKRKRILIAEDEKVTGVFLQMILEEAGCEKVNVVASGEELLEALQNEEPDIIMMDIMLDGELDGIQTAQIVKERYRIPILFMSACTDDESLDRAMATKPIDFLQKPINSVKLLKIINSMSENN